MHELSIAGAILDLARRHQPAGSTLRRIRVVAGPLRAIDRDAMRLAWRCVTADAGLDDVAIDLDLVPWHLRCSACGREWESAELESTCSCGIVRPVIVGGDELHLQSIDVDDVPEPVKGAAPCASP